jgi:hypothetical protein
MFEYGLDVLVDEYLKPFNKVGVRSTLFEIL